jgi:hypothetical protein
MTSYRYQTVRVSRSKILDVPDNEVGDFEALLRRVAAAWEVDEIVTTTFDGSDGTCDQYNCTYRKGNFYGKGFFTCCR